VAANDNPVPWRVRLIRGVMVSFVIAGLLWSLFDLSSLLPPH